ncbi:MAG TPA: hypothetical protein VE954_05890 [Oligoflexus sp.]|uniref:hypothetical protein n=1 Tax=Oligoflexus sp. TaxID=1971216 RepID=UPI002D4643D4|nr:hypothetical protein [Oligoflexus sp.]HYX32624.1 hypothetical protein [Oligoflexus sp.]
MNHRIANAFLMLSLAFPALASAEPNRGWRCMSKTVSSCEQGIFNEVERLSHPNFKDLSNKYGLALKAIRVGERLVTGYLEGELQIGGKKFPNQILEITFDPGADVDGTSIPSLGIIRYSIGDGEVDDKGQSLWAASTAHSSAVQGYYGDLLRDTFRRAVRQALGLDAPVAKPPVNTPQTCWRGCGKESEERRFHEISVLAKGIMSARPRQTVSLPLKLSCHIFRPKGTSQYPQMHNEPPAFETVFNVQYASNLHLGALELFTDSALAVLEGQIQIGGQSTQVQISSSYQAGQPIEGNLIPEFGGSWKLVTGPDNTNFWERTDFDIVVRNTLPVFRKEVAVGPYPSEVHCFDPEKRPPMEYWENPGEYNKYNFRERKSLSKNIQPLMELVQGSLKQAFAFAVKIHSKQAKLTNEEFSAYHAGYFSSTLTDVSQDLRQSFDVANRVIEGVRQSEAQTKPLIDESVQLMARETASAQQMLALKDKIMKAALTSCSGNLNQVSDALVNLNRDFDVYLQFQSDAGTVFAVSEKTAEFEKIFSALKPSVDSVDSTLASLSSILESDGSCQKLAKALAGVTLKLDAQFLAGDKDTLAKISKTALEALKKASAAKEVAAADLRLTARFEQLAMNFNSGVANLSYSQAIDGMETISAFLTQDANVEANSMIVAEDSQKTALKDKFAKRHGSLDAEFQQFLQDAGSPLELVRMRVSYYYDSLIDKILPALSSRPEAEQKAFLAAWVRKFLDNGYELSSSCLDPKTALASRALCWEVPLPEPSASARQLASFDRKLTDILNHAQQTLNGTGD